MSTKKSKKFIEQYYDLVRLGRPFLSCFPEEFVFTAILGQESYKKWILNQMNNVIKYCEDTETPEIMNSYKKEGYFFYHRKH
jgi:hypothetical protein